jgi:hypothetical protein
LISGFGRSGKAKGDIPGVRFKVVKVSGVGLLALWKEKKVRLVHGLDRLTESFLRRSHGHKGFEKLHGPTSLLYSFPFLVWHYMNMQ